MQPLSQATRHVSICVMVRQQNRRSLWMLPAGSVMGLHSVPKMGAIHRIHTPHPTPKFRRLEQTNAGIGISGSDSAILPAGPDCGGGGGGGRHRWNQSGKRKPKADLRTRFLFGAPLRLLLLLCRSAAFVVVKTEKGHLPARSPGERPFHFHRSRRLALMFGGHRG